MSSDFCASKLVDWNCVMLWQVGARVPPAQDFTDSKSRGQETTLSTIQSKEPSKASPRGSKAAREGSHAMRQNVVWWQGSAKVLCNPRGDVGHLSGCDVAGW
jgi:hypothetical protein